MLLIAEHFIDHGSGLVPAEHHWLSEYVLSLSPAGRALMHAAFVALAASALSVAILSREKMQRALFAISAAGLAAMTFFDTDPNSPIHPTNWPTLHGVVHQGCLYVAMSAGLVGMGLHLFREDRSRGGAAILSVAGIATIIQTALVAQTQGKMTLYGGLTERIIVCAVLVWVIGFCANRGFARRRPSE